MKHQGEMYGLPTISGPLFDAGPFADSTAKPTPEEILVAGLIWRCKGRAKPISIADLKARTGYSERQIKGIVEQLVVAHRIKIGASREEPYGYFVIENSRDQEAAVGPYRAQILSMWRRLRVLDEPRALRELHGQLRIDE